MKLKRIPEAGSLTSLGVGKGPVDLCEPESPESLLELLDILHSDRRDFFVLGAGTNSALRDSIPERTACISTRRLRGRAQKDGGRFEFMAGEMLPSSVGYLRNLGYSGIEFLITVPGTIGGAIVMNAGEGSPEASIAHVVEEVTVWQKGEIRHYQKEACNFAYRKSAFQEDGIIVLSAILKLALATPAEIDEKIARRRAFATGYYDTSAPNAGTIYGSCQMDSRK